MSEWATVILAAGSGTRMKSDLPKVLHPVSGTAMIAHVVKTAQSVVSGQIIVVVPPGADQIRQYLGNSVSYIEQTEPKGTGHALLQSERAFDGNVSNLLVLYGDTPLLLASTLSDLVERHQTAGAAVTLLTSDQVPPDGLGRIVRDNSGQVVEIIEEADADREHLSILEVNGGVYGFRVDWILPALRELTPSNSGETYLTDVVKLATSSGQAVTTTSSIEALEILGVNNRVQLAQAEKCMRGRILEQWMLAGVTVIDPQNTYIDASVVIERDTVIYPNTSLFGDTHIGIGCTLGPGSVIYDSIVGENCTVVASVLEEAKLDRRVNVGPFSHIRPGSVIERDVHIGNYAEIKNSRLGSGTRMGHFGYLGDADVGSDVNIGAGVVTCNFDGKSKHETVIEDGAFIGSDTLLVAPVRVGARSVTGAGSVVTRDVPRDSLAVGAPARVQRKNTG